MIHKFFNAIYYVTDPIRRIFRMLARFIPGSKRFGGISIAAKVALAIWIPMVIAAIVVLIIDIRSGTEREAFYSQGQLIPVIIFLVLLPFAAYWFVRLLSMDKIQLYPSIEDPWNAGVAALRERGIEPKTTPLILVLGTDEFDRSQAIHSDSFFNLEVDGVPGGDTHFLTWFAGSKGIFLHLRQVCRTSVSQQSLRESLGGAAAGVNPGIARTLEADSLDDYSGIDDTEIAPPTQTLSEEDFGASYGGTLTGDEPVRDFDVPDDEEAKPDAQETESGVHEDRLRERLAYTCHLLKKLRGDEVPIDGIIVTVPIKLIERNHFAVAQNIREDLVQLRACLGANFPITFLVNDVHEVKGFVKLSSMLGRKAHMSRFGKGFVVENVASSENMDDLASAGCESFKDWIYRAFGQSSTNNVQPNVELFGLLSKISLGFSDKLSVVLRKIASPPEGVSSLDYHSVTGCYFAATGRKDLGELAFVNGVVEKSIDNCENTTWTEEKQRRESILGGVAGFIVLLIIICIAAMIWIAGKEFFQWF